MTAYVAGPSGWERVGAVSDVAVEPPNPASEYDRIGETVTDALSGFGVALLRIRFELALIPRNGRVAPLHTRGRHLTRKRADYRRKTRQRKR